MNADIGVIPICWNAVGVERDNQYIKDLGDAVTHLCRSYENEDLFIDYYRIQ